MIRRFAVRNYKCLEQVDIPLTPIHVIIGQNDSGKTSLLEAMLALSRSTERSLAESFPGDWQGHDLVFSGAKTPIVEFSADLATSEVSTEPDITYKLAIRFEEKSKTCLRSDEWAKDSVAHHIQDLARSYSGVGYRSHVRTEEDRQVLDRIASLLGRTSLYRFDPQAMAIPAAIDPSRKYRMDEDGFGLATLIDDIVGYDPQLFIDLSREFCGYFPQFRRVRIETQAAIARQSQPDGRHLSQTAVGKGVVFETGDGRAVRAQQASDGAILFLGFLALIYSPEPPNLLLIEEPEKGVYPKRLEQLIHLLRRLREQLGGRRVPQIIMTTHSPFLLSLFEPEEVTFMTREGGSGAVRARPLREAPNLAERLGHGEFYLGELWLNLTEEELFAVAGR